jgi:hypothetical protein
LAQAFDERRGVRPTALRPVAGGEQGAALSERAELLEILGEKARGGNIRAVELLLWETPAERTAAAEQRDRRLLALVPDD